MAAAALLAPTPAGAVPSVVLQLANGQDAGPQSEYGGPGQEQPTSVWVEDGGKIYVVTIYMSSKVSGDDGPWQCKCSSVELSSDAAPTIVADQVQLTKNNGDRPCNHPKAASNGKSVVWLYGTDTNNANTQTYVSAVDHMCQPIMEPKKISANNNNNEGAPDIAYNGENYFTGGYLSTGENDISIAVGLHLVDLGGGQVTVEKTYSKNVVTPANIGRPTITAASPDRSLFCAAKGNNRPPEEGVQCAWMDAITGDIMFKQIIAPSQPGQKIYMNQPTVMTLENNYFALHVLESSGEGKTNNKKGSNTAHDYIITPGADAFVIAAHEVGLGNYPTHSSICSGAYGPDGEVHFASFGAAVTGNGQPLLQFFRYVNSIESDPTHNTWVAGWYADSGKLANLYGANPNTQGRDFLRCTGDIPNPGFGQPNGFLPSVKTFFAVPHAGRIPGEEKNSQWLTFVPGWTSEPITADPPADVKDVKLGPQGQDPVDSNPPDPSDPSDPAPTDPPPDDDNGSTITPTTQSACSLSASSSRDSNGLAWVGLGLGLALAARRRKGA
ncbi:MAG: hypothetical protein U0271_19535 [Polyangiaceae bacterium]